MLQRNIDVVFCLGTFPTIFDMPVKVKKLKARPKRTILAEADDHPVGLWIDKELMRKHREQLQTPRTIIHGSSEAAGNRYLELADIALGNHKSKKKSNGKADS